MCVIFTNCDIYICVYLYIYVWSLCICYLYIFANIKLIQTFYCIDFHLSFRLISNDNTDSIFFNQPSQEFGSYFNLFHWLIMFDFVSLYGLPFFEYALEFNLFVFILRLHSTPLRSQKFLELNWFLWLYDCKKLPGEKQ